MTIVRTDLNLDTLKLAAGAHKNADAGGCIMEWAAYLAGEPW